MNVRDETGLSALEKCQLILNNHDESVYSFIGAQLFPNLQLSRRTSMRNLESRQYVSDERISEYDPGTHFI